MVFLYKFSPTQEREMKQHKINDEVSFELAMGGRGTGRVIGMRTTGTLVFYVVRTPKGNEHTFLGEDLYTPTPKAKKTVRSIGRKLSDIAEAAWSQGDGGSREDEDYGCVGDVADRRIDRMKGQIEALAVMAIIGLHRDVTIAAINSSPRRDELLASALVADWDRVNQLLGDIRANTTAPLRTDAPRDCCVTGECEEDGEPEAPAAVLGLRTEAYIRLEPRDPKSPFNYPCCGGLRPAHTSHCREA